LYIRDNSASVLDAFRYKLTEPSKLVRYLRHLLKELAIVIELQIEVLVNVLSLVFFVFKRVYRSRLARERYRGVRNSILQSPM
jgi:hypothetical protein